MGTKMNPTEGQPKACTVAELNYWIDRFWDRQIFQPRGITPDEDDRKVSRFLTGKALLRLVDEGHKPGTVSGSALARAIHQVSQDETTTPQLLRFLEEQRA